jgi:hypothetical protein
MNRDHDKNKSSPISHIVLDKIQTFRTITTLLKILQDPSLNAHTTRIDDRAPLQSLQTDQHSDRRSLCVLATLLVRNRNDATAIAMQDLSTSGLPIEILVCRHESNPRMVVPEALNPATGPAGSVIEPKSDIILPDPSTMDSLCTMPCLKDILYGL